MAGVDRCDVRGRRLGQEWLSGGRRSFRHIKPDAGPWSLLFCSLTHLELNLQAYTIKMLSSTLLSLGVIPLALAAPQYHGDSHSDSDSHSHESAPASSSYDYADYLDVHPYSNADAMAWAEGKVTEYPIQFCNVSETAMIRQGLHEAEILAAHARDHIHRWGNSSSFYKKYFGLAGTAEPAGWFDKIVNADKTGVIFRCDDPDGLCAANESRSRSNLCLKV